jgi:hypothetical protein
MINNKLKVGINNGVSENEKLYDTKIKENIVDI